ncbi:PPE domain-containing protein [Nocardia implantans]|uniref:PPE domain-containing protein n=1 Tax=Nocardia implantans TaxID=3108168 RepID=A0ABU6AW37_9NOCA|nr:MULTISPECIES: PPE domain-containing protein [unclassified Nocardia]MBF6192921.1 PPE domain-containing protein [Nocardia beijingensis]MEA3531361.1 PPE domain-containing protein [Nocardia sp. CDC192]MEB3511708.1 PPE domain-containing protein [Nocardia sp. CDC186]
MIEPPQPGFTGVVWTARPPERLARDLTTGPGAVPMAEAVAAWSRLAASFGAAVAEYEKVLADVRGAWQSGRSDEVLRQISTLRDWLVDAAAAAAANAARFQAQVTAYEIARLAMPDTADLENLQQLQRMLESMGGMLGGPIRAIAAETDADQDAAKAVASRVMRNYELATEPLALPWQHQEPPVVAPEQALAAEQAEAAQSAAVPRGAAPIGALPIGTAPIPAMPRVRTAYQAPVYAQSATAADVVPRTTQATTVNTGGQPAPLVPGALGQAGSAPDAARFPRASLPTETSDQIGFEGGIQAAPAVLGGAEPAAVAQTETSPEPGGAP